MPVDSAFPLPALVDTQIHTCVCLGQTRSSSLTGTCPGSARGPGSCVTLDVSIPAPRSWFLSTSPMKRGLDCRIHEVPHRGCVCGTGCVCGSGVVCVRGGAERTPHPCSPWARSSSRSSSYSGSGSSRSGQLSSPALFQPTSRSKAWVLRQAGLGELAQRLEPSWEPKGSGIPG